MIYDLFIRYYVHTYVYISYAKVIVCRILNGVCTESSFYYVIRRLNYKVHSTGDMAM